ncbi:hypothetical protein TNCV_2933501 [Trichonephila clavipes]|nr:hypothetical protein TNCV_2933501 [Trichonephila clavipes]
MVDQKVCDVQRITIRRDGQVLNTKHLILTFSTPELPQSLKPHISIALFYLTFQIRSVAFSAKDLDIPKQSAVASQPALDVQR